MSEEMKIVNTWCNETEVLLDEYDVMEQKLQEMNVGYKAGPASGDWGTRSENGE